MTEQSSKPMKSSKPPKPPKPSKTAQSAKSKIDTRSPVVIGDVHGCIDELKALLKKLEYSPSKHRLIFVGDLINKGPDSLSVLKLVRGLDAEVVLGNHEMNFIKQCQRGVKRSEEQKALEKQLGPNLDQWVEYMSTWPLYIEANDFMVVHGGLVPGLHPKDTDPNLTVNLRTWDGVGEDINNHNHKAWFDLYEGHKLVLFGHWARLGLMVRRYAIGLDTGCVYGRKLTAMILPERRVVQVKAAKPYKIPSSV